MANTVFKLRRSSVAGKKPTTSDIAIGELGLNLTDRILYSSDGSNIWEIGANNTNSTVSNTLTVEKISANGSVGSAGQLLTSNGASVYWSTPSGGTVTSVSSGNGLSGGPITTTGTLSVLANTGIVANATGVFVNSAYINTISSNNTTYVNGKTEGNLNVNNALTANDSSYLGGTSASGYQTTAGLSANVATLTSNNATYAYGKTESNLNVNSATQATNATNLNSQPGSYYTNATNITTGTLPYAQLGSAVVNTSGNFTLGGVITYNANVALVGNSISVMTVSTINATSNGVFIGNNVIQVGNNSVYSNLTPSTLYIGASVIANSTGANNAFNLNNQAASYYTNATNITTGTLPYAQIPANIVNTTGSFTLGGITTFNANVALIGNSTSSLTVSTINSTSNGVLIGNNILQVGNTSVYANLIPSALYIGATLIANSTGPYGKTEGNLNVNSATQATNATNLNSQPGSYYTNATNITTGTLPWAQAPSNTANLSASQTFAGNTTFSANVFVTGAQVNAVQFQTGAPLTGTGGILANTTTLIVGNNTINTTVTSAGLIVNGAVTVNSTGFYTGNTTDTTTGTGAFLANDTTILVGNNTINTKITSAGLIVNNVSTVNNTGVYVGTTGTGTGGTIANTTVFFTGNNTVNAYLTTTQLNVNAVTIANTSGFYTTGTTNAGTISTGSVNVLNAFGLTTSANISIGAAGDLYLTANAGLSANGGFGTAGQVLTSNASSVYWSTISGGATLTANSTDTVTYYLPMANTSSGAWTNGVVSTTKLYFVPSTGTLSATIFNSLSDINTKTNIETINNALSFVKNMDGVSFNWKDNGVKSYGVIAQHIEKIIPEIVSENKGVKSVNYDAIIAFLIQAVKELSEKVDKLENGK